MYAMWTLCEIPGVARCATTRAAFAFGKSPYVLRRACAAGEGKVAIGRSVLRGCGLQLGTHIWRGREKEGNDSREGGGRDTCGPRRME